MTALQITLIVVLVIVFVVGIITYFMRGKYYEQIDKLDQQKKDLLQQAPHKKLKEAKELSITGQSSERREQFEAQWQEIESVKYPKIENYLFEAEQATDRYRLNESKRKQEEAREMMANLEEDMANLSKALTELIEKEQENLEKVDAIKKRYHEVRKSLLAYSFSFGPASESFEEKLNLMEEDFTEFSEQTVSGDHEEATKIINRLVNYIQETEEEMEKVPSLLTKVNEKIVKDLEDLSQGYEQMREHGYLFPDDKIAEMIHELEEDKQFILENIQALHLNQANEAIEGIEKDIENLYRIMETEIEAEAKVDGLLEDNKQAIYYLQDEIRRLFALESRLSQSYVMLHEEKEKLDEMEKQLLEAIEEYEILAEKTTDKALAYSIIDNRLNYLFKKLDQLNNQKEELSDTLTNYRKEELYYKEEMHAMEEAMYNMKRALSSQRLPGLPKSYLELFFSTTERIEQLANDLSQTKISLVTVNKMHKIAEEDVIQLSKMTEEIIEQVSMIEEISQRLYRFKDEHKGVLETIRYSESLFNEDYDYSTAVRLLKEKLENVAPGLYDEIYAKYQANKRN